MMYISKKYFQFCFSFLMSFCISGAISLFFTLKNAGLSHGFFIDWIFGSWVYAFAIAFPMAYFLPKIIYIVLKKREEME